MANFTSQGNGLWTNGGTWDQGGPLPTAADNVSIVHNLTANVGGEVCLDFDIDASGSIQGSVTASGDVTLTDGSIDTTFHLTMDGTKNLAWNDSGEPLTSLTIAGGVTVTLTGTTYTKKLTATGNLAGAAQILYISGPTAAWWSQAGTVGCILYVDDPQASPGDNIDIDDKECRIFTGATRTLTMDGDLDTGTGVLKVFGDGAGFSMTLTMDGNALTCGALTPGAAAANTGNGIINCGTGTISCASVADGNNANSGNELNFDTSTFTCSGTIDCENIAVTAGDCAIGCAEFDVSAAVTSGGTFTLTDDLNKITGNFSLDGGTINTATNDLTVDGDVTYNSGSVTELILAQGGTSDILWTSFGHRITSLTVAAGATVTLTGSTQVSKYTGVGNLAGGASKTLWITVGGANWWGVQSGTVGCRVIILSPSASPGNDITLADMELQFYAGGSNLTLTMDANIDMGSGQLLLYAGNGFAQTLDMNGNDCACGNLRFGDTSANDRSGKFIVGSGAITVASAATGHAANTNNEFDFTTAGGEVTLGGTFDGSDIDCLGPASGGSIFRAGLGTPVIQDAVFDNVVYAEWGITISDAENVNVNRWPTAPFGIDAADTYIPGAVAAQVYIPGAAAAQVYIPGAAAAEVY